MVGHFVAGWLEQWLEHQTDIAKIVLLLVHIPLKPTCCVMSKALDHNHPICQSRCIHGTDTDKRNKILPAPL